MAESGFTINEFILPSSLEEDRDGIFAGMVEVRNACEVAGYGTPEVADTAEEIFPHYLDEQEVWRFFVARVDGRIVGRGALQWLIAEDKTAWVELHVHPDYHRRGIGRALADGLESLARELGRTRLISYAVSADGPGERLTPPTGLGSVPASNREVRFLLARGWNLEQVERGSRFPLPADAVALKRLRADAESYAGDYHVISWVGRTPAELLDDMAVLYTRMSTDAPSAGLQEPEDVWTAERLAAREAHQQEAPMHFIYSAVRHAPGGRLVGFTVLAAPHETGRAVSQWATLVLREHRGHRLGMLLKIANLELLEQTAPGQLSVLTWNAEENWPMLSVNEAVGFVPIGSEGAWAKSLA